MFPQCASVDAEAYGDVYAAKHFGTGNKLGLFTCVETSLCPAFRKSAVHYAPKVGIRIVYNQTVSLTQVDFTQQCIGARKAGATMVTVVADSASLGRFGVDCSRQGYNPLYAQGSATVSGVTNTQPGLSNVIVGLPTFPFAGVHGNPAIDQFTAAMAKYDQGDPAGPAASFGWAGAKLFETVARIAAAKGAITPSSLMAAAYTLHHNTLGGLTAPLTYVKGKPAPDFKCTFIVSGRGGHWTAPMGLKQICAP
jgi:branched-chain amino acid transport system substrate-binding protein